jgi:hypothetical protein
LPGDPGLSAYQIWLNNGNSGSEADFLALYQNVKPDWNAAAGSSAEILNKPAVFSGNYNDLSNKPQGNNEGDLLYWGNSNWNILPVGMEGQVLAIANGRPTWIEPVFTNNEASTYQVGDVFYDSSGNPEGVVFELSLAGRYAKIVSLTESVGAAWDPVAIEAGFDPDYTGTLPIITHANNAVDGSVNTGIISHFTGWEASYPAFAACTNQGNGWYLPATGELAVLAQKLSSINQKLGEIAGATQITYNYYWTSTEIDQFYANSMAVKDFSETFFAGTEDEVTIDFIAGETMEQLKSEVLPVRAVRKLSWAETTGKPVGKLYAIGDIYYAADGATPVGIVYAVSSGGVHGKALSLAETDLAWSTVSVVTGATDFSNGAVNQAKIATLSPADYPAFTWAASLGVGWYLPSEDELGEIYLKKTDINAALTNKQPLATQLVKTLYWSSSEAEADKAYGFYFGTQGTHNPGEDEALEKSTVAGVRAIYIF